jgi:hypothetical protein
MIRLFRATAPSSSSLQTRDVAESGLSTKRKASADSTAPWISSMNSTVGGMPSQSTQTSLPRPARAATRVRTKSMSLRE